MSISVDKGETTKKETKGKKRYRGSGMECRRTHGAWGGHREAMNREENHMFCLKMSL